MKHDYTEKANPICKDCSYKCFVECFASVLETYYNLMFLIMQICVYWITVVRNT